MLFSSIMHVENKPNQRYEQTIYIREKYIHTQQAHTRLKKVLEFLYSQKKDSKCVYFKEKL